MKQDVSESVQQSMIEEWAAEHDPPIEIVGWAVDLNVSGSVDPFARGELGEWLNNRLDQFDTMLVWKQDRLSRDQADTHIMWRFMEKIKKGCAFITEGTDFSNPEDHLNISMRALMAEDDLKKYRERARTNKINIRKRGGWQGGKLPFGLRRAADGTIEWVPYYAEIILKVIDWVIAGVSLNQVTQRLEDLGVPTPRQAANPEKGAAKWGWSIMSVRFILSNRALLGEMTHAGKPMRDTNGDPVKGWPALIDVETFDRLQAALYKRRRSETPIRMDTSPLRRVGHCVCGSVLHYQPEHIGTGGYQRKARYACDARRRKMNDCLNPGLNAEDIEDYLEDSLLNFRLDHLGYEWETFGDVPRYRREYRAVVDHRHEIRKLGELIKELKDDYLADKYEDDEEFYRSQLDDYESRRRKLIKESKEQGNGYRFLPTGSTVREYWQSCNKQQRNQFLLEIKVIIKYDKRSGVLQFQVDFGEVQDLVRIAQQAQGQAVK